MRMPDGRQLLVAGRRTAVLHRHCSGGADDYNLFETDNGSSYIASSSDYSKAEWLYLLLNPPPQPVFEKAGDSEEHDGASESDEVDHLPPAAHRKGAKLAVTTGQLPRQHDENSKGAESDTTSTTASAGTLRSTDSPVAAGAPEDNVKGVKRTLDEIEPKNLLELLEETVDFKKARTLAVGGGDTELETANTKEFEIVAGPGATDGAGSSSSSSGSGSGPGATAGLVWAIAEPGATDGAGSSSVPSTSAAPSMFTAAKTAMPPPVPKDKKKASKPRS